MPSPAKKPDMYTYLSTPLLQVPENTSFSPPSENWHPSNKEIKFL